MAFGTKADEPREGRNLFSRCLYIRFTFPNAKKILRASLIWPHFNFMMFNLLKEFWMSKSLMPILLDYIVTGKDQETKWFIGSADFKAKLHKWTMAQIAHIRQTQERLVQKQISKISDGKRPWPKLMFFSDLQFHSTFLRDFLNIIYLQ